MAVDAGRGTGSRSGLDVTAEGDRLGLNSRLAPAGTWDPALAGTNAAARATR